MRRQSLEEGARSTIHPPGQQSRLPGYDICEAMPLYKRCSSGCQENQNYLGKDGSGITLRGWCASLRCGRGMRTEKDRPVLVRTRRLLVVPLPAIHRHRGTCSGGSKQGRLWLEGARLNAFRKDILGVESLYASQVGGYCDSVRDDEGGIFRRELRMSTSASWSASTFSLRVLCDPCVSGLGWGREERRVRPFLRRELEQSRRIVSLGVIGVPRCGLLAQPWMLSPLVGSLRWIEPFAILTSARVNPLSAWLQRHRLVSGVGLKAQNGGRFRGGRALGGGGYWALQLGFRSSSARVLASWDSMVDLKLERAGEIMTDENDVTGWAIWGLGSGPWPRVKRRLTSFWEERPNGGGRDSGAWHGEEAEIVGIPGSDCLAGQRAHIIRLATSIPSQAVVHAGFRSLPLWFIPYSVIFKGCPRRAFIHKPHSVLQFNPPSHRLSEI
ncbi:hypothetical protein FA13DRAFT_1711866 [Coprinellus micaceus]|uniref:Uncharacterized protein n=1 Tax=Coprinellus micaceus TaxID=71717 RepID=A0A4Y7T2C8_COPMI|nr:hypothetical protein FA13DRAFT_1711866 [Coprinellus micaceus]